MADDRITDAGSSDVKDTVDISNVVNYDAGDTLAVGNDGSGHVKLVIEDSANAEKGSITFDDITYSGHDTIDLLKTLVDIDDGTNTP